MKLGQKLKATKVVHVSSVHPHDDVRVFVKECRSLAASGHSVVYIVSAQADEVIDGVQIRALRASKGRFRRVLNTALQAYRKAAAEKADIYQFHDPELIPLMVWLKLRQPRAKVIYDTHEDMPGSIRAKHWIPTRLRKPVSTGVRLMEKLAVKRFDAVVAATPTIARNFPPGKTVTVQNFPMLEEFPPLQPSSYHFGDTITLFHSGRVSSDRGGREMIRAMGQVKKSHPAVKLVIAGMFVPAEYDNELAQEDGWDAVEFVGWKNREDMRTLLANADIGIALMHPVENYVAAQPNKLFEYMAAGLPVVASDFPWWRNIIEGSGAGLLANPQDPESIADKIEWLIGHPDEAHKMGVAGRRAVDLQYNWTAEFRKLHELYTALEKNGPTDLKDRLR
jgi:glycosyltransferase involved in cell wall biosynthesis